MQPTAFSLAGLDLQSGYYRISETDAFGTAEREIKAMQLAREDGAVAVFKRFKDRNINASGVIKAPDKSTAEASLDQLKAAIAGLNALSNLDVGYRGSTRRWQVFSANILVPRGGRDVSVIPFSLQLYSPKPYALDTAASTLVTPGNHTTGTSYWPIIVSGSYPAQPVITLTVSAINPSNSSVDIIVGNSAENRYLTIRGQRTVGDIITIDTQNKQLYINGTLTQPYGGQFPLWAPGPGTVEISDTATTRTIAVADSYTPRWL